MKSLQRALKCDGLIAEKQRLHGQEQSITPSDIAAIHTYIQDNRTATIPFDIIVVGKTAGWQPVQIEDTLLALTEVGAPGGSKGYGMNRLSKSGSRLTISHQANDNRIRPMSNPSA